jgi:hypothetical protein
MPAALSPDFNPIEMAFAKLKALRKAAERTVDGLWTAIGELIDLFSHKGCRSWTVLSTRLSRGHRRIGRGFGG